MPYLVKFGEGHWICIISLSAHFSFGAKPPPQLIQILSILVQFIICIGIIISFRPNLVMQEGEREEAAGGKSKGSRLGFLTFDPLQLSSNAI